MIKILHTADLHLDSPFASLSPPDASSRREKLLEVFTSMTTYACTEKVDLFLIAGDLFDADFVRRETVELICRELAGLPDTFTVISPGNHDPYSPGSVWEKMELPPNVHLFRSDRLERVSIPGKNTDVYGYAFTSESLRNSPIAGRHVEDPPKINILCAHAQIDEPISVYAPLSRTQLADFGADYAALGHIHNADGMHAKAGCCTWAYSGCPEGRSFDECGEKHALTVRIEKSGGTADVQVGKKSFSPRRFEKISVDVTGSATGADVRDAVQTALRGSGFGRDTALRLRLTGQTANSIGTEGLRDVLGVGSLEICDETLPVWNAGLDADPTLRGEFYRAIKPRLESADGHEREVALRALKYTLAVMAGENVPEEE